MHDHHHPDFYPLESCEGREERLRAERDARLKAPGPARIVPVVVGLAAAASAWTSYPASPPRGSWIRHPQPGVNDRRKKRKAQKLARKKARR